MVQHAVLCTQHTSSYRENVYARVTAVALAKEERSNKGEHRCMVLLNARRNGAKRGFNTASIVAVCSTFRSGLL